MHEKRVPARRREIAAAALCALFHTASAYAQTPVTDLVLQIGRLDGPPHYSLGSPAAVRALPGGRILILDSQTAQLHVYDSQGTHLVSAGRKGSGPGEFERPGSVFITATDIVVHDFRLSRISRFRHDGTHVETVRQPDAGGMVVGAVPLRNGRWLGQHPPSLSSEHIQQVVRGDRRAGGSGIGRVIVFDTVRVDTLARYLSGSAFWFEASEGRAFGGLPGYGDGVLVSIAGDSTAVIVDAHRGRITWFSADPVGLVPIHHIDLRLEPRPVTAADRQELERSAREGQTGQRWGRLGFILPEQRAWFRGAILDNRGRVWLRRDPPPASRGPTGHVYLMVQPDGALREFRLPEGATLSSVHDDLLFTTARSDLDVPLARVYRLPR
jgi:hypothetical protein